MNYDCAWYKPEGRDEALPLVRRLSVAECARRRSPYGLRFWFDSVKMPLAGFGMCSFVVRNFRGSSALIPSSDTIFDLVCIKETTPWFITADFVNPPEGNPTVKRAAECEQVAEQCGQKQFEKEGGMRIVWMRKGVARYFDAASVVFGKHPPHDGNRDDAELLRRLVVEDERRTLRDVANRIKRFLTRQPREPLQMRFLNAIYPFLLSGEVPGYTPRPATDEPVVIEEYYRKVLSSLPSVLNRGAE